MTSPDLKTLRAERASLIAANAKGIEGAAYNARAERIDEIDKELAARVATLRDLKARIDAATGPDREIDARILCAFFAPAGSEVEHIRRYDRWIINRPHGCSWRHWDELPTVFLGRGDRISASIDAALALVERMLPGWAWNVQTDSRTTGVFARLDNPDLDVEPAAAHCETAPLAILSALLSALISQQEAANAA